MIPVTIWDSGMLQYALRPDMISVTIWDPGMLQYVLRLDMISVTIWIQVCYNMHSGLI